jgi:hypothetical protein
VISAAQRDRVLGYLELARAEGGTFATGGGVDETRPRGFWVRPTVIAGLGNDARVAREEIFGPVLTVIPHDGDDDAVRIANDSDYGLLRVVRLRLGSSARRLVATGIRHRHYSPSTAGRHGHAAARRPLRRATRSPGIRPRDGRRRASRSKPETKLVAGDGRERRDGSRRHVGSRRSRSSRCRAGLRRGVRGAHGRRMGAAVVVAGPHVEAARTGRRPSWSRRRAGRSSSAPTSRTQRRPPLRGRAVASSAASTTWSTTPPSTATWRSTC